MKRGFHNQIFTNAKYSLRGYEIFYTDMKIHVQLLLNQVPYFGLKWSNIGQKQNSLNYVVILKDGKSL